MKMYLLPVNRGTILTVKGKQVVIVHFGGMGDDRAYVVPLKGKLDWRGRTYSAKSKVGMPLTANDVKRALSRH